MDEAEEVRGCLLVARGDRPKAFEPMKEAFNLASQPIQLPILPSAVVLARRVHRDDRLELSLARSVHNPVGVVTGIGDQRLAGRVLDEVLSFSRVVLLPRGQRDFERLAFRRGDDVELRRKTSPRTPQSIASDPPFPPAASWCARTTVASMREPMSSTSTWSSLKTASHTPRCAQRANRLYTVFHGPNRSWRSRQGTPVLARQSTALMNSLSPRLLLGPGVRGSRGRTRSHCVSVSSWRCTASVDHFFDLGSTMICSPFPMPSFRLRAHNADQKIRDTP